MTGNIVAPRGGGGTRRLAVVANTYTSLRLAQQLASLFVLSLFEPTRPNRRRFVSKPHRHPVLTCVRQIPKVV